MRTMNVEYVGGPKCGEVEQVRYTGPQPTELHGYEKSAPIRKTGGGNVVYNYVTTTVTRKEDPTT